MKPFLLTFLTILNLTINSQSLKRQLLKQDSTLEDVEVVSCKADPNLFLVTLVTQLNWWEELKIVKFKNDKILWTAKFDTLPSSQSILTARQISLKGISYPLIEVFDVTHMGNGFYYLYKLNGKSATLLIKTRAVDWNMDMGLEYKKKFDCSIVYKNGRLKRSYKDVNNDGYTDIILRGTIQIFDSDWKTKLKEYPAQKVLIYDKTKRKYVEDLKQRIGFEPDDD